MAKKRKVPANVERILDSLASQDDRSVALVGVSLVEHFLEIAIVAKLRLSKADKEHLFSFRGPAGSLENKIFLASALRITAEKTTRDLTLMRQIRNEFAHDMNEIGFEAPHIKSRIDEFHAVAMLYRMTKDTGHSLKERFIKQVWTLVGGFQLQLETKSAITSE